MKFRWKILKREGKHHDRVENKKHSLAECIGFMVLIQTDLVRIYISPDLMSALKVLIKDTSFWKDPERRQIFKKLSRGWCFYLFRSQMLLFFTIKAQMWLDLGLTAGIPRTICRLIPAAAFIWNRFWSDSMRSERQRDALLSRSSCSQTRNEVKMSFKRPRGKGRREGCSYLWESCGKVVWLGSGSLTENKETKCQKTYQLSIS